MRVDVDDFRGKWASILPAIGIDKRFLVNRHGPCPFCEGKDRFRFDDRDAKGTWFCSHCGAGDGIKLAMLALGLNFRDTLARLAPIAGVAPIEPRQDRSAKDPKLAMRKLWRESRPLTPDDPAGCYLIRRLGAFPSPKALRWSPAAFYDGEIPNRRPALLALVRAPNGSAATIHRTFLTDTGEKAPGSSPRRLMPGEFPAGGAVRLAAETDVLGVAEGIETALAASMIFHIPVWACLTAGNMEAFKPPETVRRLVIFGDNDLNCRGQAAAYTLAFRRSSDRVEIEVKIAPMGDWNDILKQSA